MNKLRGVNSILAASERNADVSVQHVNFPSKDCSMQLNGLFLNRSILGIILEKHYCAVATVFSIIGAYISPATRFYKDAFMTGVHRVYFEMDSEVLSRIYGREWSVSGYEELCRDVYVFKHMLVSMALPVSTARLLKQKVNTFDHLIENSSMFGIISALDASSYDQFNTIIKVSYRHTLKRRVTLMNETMLGLDQMQTTALWKMSCG